MSCVEREQITPLVLFSTLLPHSWDHPQIPKAIPNLGSYNLLGLKQKEFEMCEVSSTEVSKNSTD